MSDYPSNFDLLNSVSPKFLNTVLRFSNSDVTFSMLQNKKKARYGDPGLKYGQAGLMYGGLIDVDNSYPYLSPNTSLVVGNIIEPEQGRGSTQTINIELIDKDGFVSNFVSPGQQLDEIMGGTVCEILIGYQNSSYPEDYFVIHRGYTTKITYAPTKVILEISDANIKRRQQTFFSGKTNLTADINNSVTTIPITTTDGFYRFILGPDGGYDPSVKLFILIGDEYMEIPTTATFNPTSIVGVVRGVLGTAPAAHSLGDDVTNQIQLEGNIMDLSLKVMLSGWDGDWLSDLPIFSFVKSTDPDTADVNNGIFLPLTVDPIRDYGLADGDYITVTGSGLNDGTYVVTGFSGYFGVANTIILVDQVLNLEPPDVTAIYSIRSQYDTLPVDAGVKLRPDDVDIARFQYIKNTFFSQNDNSVRILITEPQNAKNLIESEFFLPVGAYSITRFGRLSVTCTMPPIIGQKLSIIDENNLIDPQSTIVTRGLNTRRFFNEVQYYFDVNNAGDPTNVFKTLDTDSLNKFDLSSVLPINSKGLRTDLGAVGLIQRRGGYILRRYKDAAFEIDLKVNFKTGSQIEVGDIVAVYDQGTLKIINFSNGTRNLGAQLFEVIRRSMDLKTGLTQVKLLGVLGYQLTDRFGTISPSSISTGGSTSTIDIQDSFGAVFPGDEQAKWTPYIGQKIRVHSETYSFDQVVDLLGFDPGNPYRMLVSTLASPAVAGWIVNIDAYPQNSDPSDHEKYKIAFCFQDPSLTVVTGISTTSFTVSPSDAALLLPGMPVLVHSVSYAFISDESIVDTVVGTTVTLKTAIGFVPSPGYLVELVGFLDGGGPYRLI